MRKIALNMIAGLALILMGCAQLPKQEPASAPDRTLIPLDGTIHTAALEGDWVYLAAGEKGLVRINLRSQEVRIYKRFPGESVDWVGVEQGKAYVRTYSKNDHVTRHIRVIDVLSDEVLNSMEVDFWGSIGPAPNGRLYVIDTSTIRIIDPTSGDILHEVKVPGV